MYRNLKTVKFFIKSNFKYLLAPIFIFAGTFFVDPLFNIAANSDTIPYYQCLFVLCTIFFYSPKPLLRKTNNTAVSNWIMFILLYAIIISQVSILNKISFLIVIIFSKIISDIRNYKKYYLKIFSFTLSYLILCVLIYATRLIMYDFDLFKVRGGMNIWGGNSLIMVIQLFMCIQILFKKSRKEILLSIIITLTLSIVFISRTAIITSLIIFIIYFNSYLKQNFWKSILFSLFGIFLINKYFINSNLLEMITLRFSTFDLNQIDTAFSFLESVSLDRADLWVQVFNVMSENPLGIGVDSFNLFSIYSTPHNILLDNIIISGYFFGMILNMILISPLFIFLKLKMKKNKLLIIIVYSSFLVTAIFSGAKFIQASGYVSSFILLYFLALYNTINLSRKNNFRND
tara:strand:- start:4679 stop:5884 length:1206 start_codon:yes stop_codon:yes gene_type:complete